MVTPTLKTKDQRRHLLNKLRGARLLKKLWYGLQQVNLTIIVGEISFFCICL